MKTRTRPVVRKYEGPFPKDMPGKWFVMLSDTSYYVTANGSLNTTAYPDGWFQTRQQARNACKAYKNR